MKDKYIPRHAKKWYKKFDKLMNKKVVITIGELVGAVLLTALIVVIGYNIAKAMLNKKYIYTDLKGHANTSMSCKEESQKLVCLTYIEVESYEVVK